MNFQDCCIGIIGSYACLTSLSDASDLQLPPVTIVQMAKRPTGVDEAIEFVWNQPDTVLQSSEKQSLSAILAKETDVVARRYFLAPLPEQWVGTLKELLAPRGEIPVCDKLWLPLHFQEASEHTYWLECFSTLYKHTCGVENPVHVAQGFAVGCTAMRRRYHKEVKQHHQCIFTNYMSSTNGSSQLHLWLEGLLMIFTLNASVPAMHACGKKSSWRYHCSVKGNRQVVQFLLQT